MPGISGQYGIIKTSREVMLPRAKIEKNIKKVIKPGQE